MSRIKIDHATVVMLEELAEDHTVIIEDGKIVSIGPSEKLAGEVADETIDAAGSYVSPGFTDLHIHGVCGIRLDDSVDAFADACRAMPQFGVTSWLPTLLARPKGQDAEFLAELAKVQPEGSETLGFHMEGPFLALTGAIPKESLGPADVGRVKAMIEAAKPYKTIFSVSPDFENVLDLIPLMSADNTPVFMTHTAATGEQTDAAIAVGASHATHFFNVFPPIDDAEGGVRGYGAAEAILADPSVSVDIILDGEHVHPQLMKMAMQCKGPDRVCLISDSSCSAGMPPGRYNFADAEIITTYEGGPARMAPESRFPNGLAGSGLTMDRAVRNAIKFLDVDLPTAVRMASANPIKVLGLDGSKGQIAHRYDADIIIMDKDLNVTQTFVGGKSVYLAGDQE